MIRKHVQVSAPEMAKCIIITFTILIISAKTFLFAFSLLYLQLVPPAFILPTLLQIFQNMGHKY